MSSKDEESRSDTPEIDFSVIRTAIQIGGKVVEQIMNGVHYGSKEVRNLLLEECDVILECKVCRNLFRSLPNFVAHKRVYCTPTFEEHKKKENEPVDVITENTVIVQPASPDEKLIEPDATTSEKATPLQSVTDKVIDRSFEGQSKTYEFYTKLAEKVEAKKITTPVNSVTLKSIPTNPNAVILKVNESSLQEKSSETAASKVNDDASGMVANIISKTTKTKPTISQLCENLAKKPAIPQGTSQNQNKNDTVSLRPVRSRKSSPRKSIDNYIGMMETNKVEQSKTSSPASVQTGTNTPDNDSDSNGNSPDFNVDMQAFISDYALDRAWLAHCDINSLKCKTCEKSFSTPYGLKFHCKMKHVDKQVQYPCPVCTKSFTYFTALARHLRKVHTKSESYIGFIQSKLKSRQGRRKSIEDTQTESNDTESSPENSKKNMLAVDTGWKKCDKCGKICWKAKSYYRHYQYCKGSVDDTSKIQNGDSSPAKNTGQKEKDHGKRATDKLKGNMNEVTETVKEKPKFNENLTIRTRKQLENNLVPSPENSQQSQTDILNKNTDSLQSNQNEESVTSKNKQVNKNMMRHIDQREPGALDESKQSIRTTEKNIIPQKIVDIALQNSPILSVKTRRSTDQALKTKQYNLDKSVGIVMIEDNLSISGQEKSLNAKHTHGSTKDASEEMRKNKIKSQEEEKSPIKTNVIKVSRALDKEYKKPVTRAADGTLSMKENKTIHSSKSNSLAQSAGVSEEDKANLTLNAAKEKEDKNSDVETNHSYIYIKPVTRQTDSTLSKQEKAHTLNKNIASCKSASVVGFNYSSVNELKGQGTNDQSKNDTVCINQKEIQLIKPLRGVSVSPEIPRSPEPTEQTTVKSIKGSLDSPVWSDNPMLKFKMTVKEMAELVESASLTRFARERKKKAKQILNKKQNGGNQTVNIKNAAKSVKHVKGKVKVINKKTVGAAKKVYRTRLSTGSKAETASNSAAETEPIGHRYSTRYTDIKTIKTDTGADVTDQNAVSKQKTDNVKCKEGNTLVADVSSKVTSLAPTKSTRLSIEPLDKTTVNSKRKEYLAAKRDQRRKFLLANKSASPIKVKPDDSVQIQPRTTRNIFELVSASPSKNKMMENKLEKEKKEDTERHVPVLRHSRHRVVESDDQQVKNKMTEVTVTGKSSAVQNLPRRLSDRVKGQDKKAENTDKTMVCYDEQTITSQSTKAVTERQSRHSASYESSLQKNKIELRSKSASMERPASSLVHKNEKENQIATRRARSSENVQRIAVTADHEMVHQKLVDMELKKTSKKSNDTPESVCSDMTAPHVAQSNQNLPTKDGKTNKSETGTGQKKILQNYHSLITNKVEENSSCIHQTRLSTGSLMQVNKPIESLFKEHSTKVSAEEPVHSSPSALCETQIKNQTVRKKHLSAPEKPSKPEPKRYSLLTGVIQCGTCSKTFWKKTSYTCHMLKSPCGKKQKEVRAEEKVPKIIETNKSKANVSLNEETIVASSVASELLKDPNRTLKAEISNEITRTRSQIKRPLSDSPESASELGQLAGNLPEQGHIKRPRLKIEVIELELPNASKQSVNDITADKITCPSLEKQKHIEEPVTPIHDLDNGSDESVVARNMDASTFSIDNLYDLPGTSKDFFDDDSDSGSEFSGFSEADLSFPILPEAVSDHDSDSSLESDSGEDIRGSSCERDDPCIASKDFMEKELTASEKRKIISVEEIWVNKEPGMPAVEKSKSNRIYVMDTDRSNKLHCQDKRNIDSFVDEDRLKCLRCEREFSSISNVRQHVIRHLGWKRYQCKLCIVFSCYNLSEVRMHLSRSHGIQAENEVDLRKHVKDLNKEAGKKRSTKRMKTIEKKKKLESSSTQNDVFCKSKRQPRKESSSSAGISDMGSLNDLEPAVHVKSSQNRSETIGAVVSTPVTSSINKHNTAESNEAFFLKNLHDVTGNGHDSNEKHKIGLITDEEPSTSDSNNTVPLKIHMTSSSPVKKSIRLAAKQNSRKSAAEILKGPKLSPKKYNTSVSLSSGEKKSGSPKKVVKSPPETNSIEKSDESPLFKARQMLAMVLK